MKAHFKESKRLTSLIEADDLLKLKYISIEKKTDMSSIVRELIEKYLKRIEDDIVRSSKKKS